MKLRTKEVAKVAEKVNAVWKWIAFIMMALLALSLIYIVINVYISDNYNKYGFPYGKFASGSIVAEFRKDGTAEYRNSSEHWTVPVKYGINKNLYTEMAHNYPSTPKIPATYYWEYDGKKITFKLWGVDDNAHRKYVMTSLPYTKIK